MGPSAKVCLGVLAPRGQAGTPPRGQETGVPTGRRSPHPHSRSPDTWPAAPGHSNRPSPRTTRITDPSAQSPGPPPHIADRSWGVASGRTPAG